MLNQNIKIYSILMSLIILVLGFYILYYFTNNGVQYGKESQVNVSQEKIIENSNKLSVAIDEKSNSISNFANFEKVADTLYKDEGSSDYEKLNSLVSKAVAMPLKYLVLDSYRNTEFINSYSLMYKAYKEGKSIAQPERDYLLSKISIQLYRQFASSCFMYREFYLSDWKEDANFKLISKKYNNTHLATLVFMHGLLKESKDNTKNLFATKAFVEAQILDSFGDVLNNTEYLYFKQELNSSLDKYKNEKDSDLYINGQGASVYRHTLPIYIYFSKIIANKVNENNAYDIDIELKQLEESANLLESEGYKDAIVENKNWWLIMAIGYNYDNYVNDKSAYNKQKLDNSITKLIKHESIASKNLEYKDRYILYLSNINTDMGSWDNIRQRLAAASKVSPDLLKLLKSYGYKPSN